MDSSHPYRWSRLLFGALATFILCGQILEAERASECPSLSMTLKDTEVASVEPGGTAASAGLRPRDTIVRIGEREIPPTWEAGAFLRAYSPGATIPLVVRREGALLALEYTPAPPTHLEVLERLTTAGAGIVTVLVGLLVYFKKPRGLTLIFASICLGMGHLVLPPFVPAVPWLLQLRTTVLEIFTLLIPPLFVHLFLLFPLRHPWLDRHSGLPLALYLPSAILLVFSLGTRLAAGAGPGPPRSATILATAAPLLLVGGLATALVLFLQGYRRAQTETSRRKVRVVLWGTILGTLPVAILVTIYQLWPQARLPGIRLAALSIVLVPLSFGYAIVRHGVFDATLIVRRSLAFSVLGALLVLAYLGTQMILRAVLGPASAISPVGISFLSLIAAAGLYLPAKRGMRALLGGVLGPERRETLAWLRDFSQTLRAAQGRQEVVRRVTDFIGDALGAQRVAHFERTHDGAYRTAYVYGVPAADLAPLKLTPSLSRQLAQCSGPTDWADLESDLPYGYLSPADQRVLTACATELILPLRAGGLDDLILVGRHVLGEPFSAEDLRLAESISGEARMALANALLEQRISEDERLNFEMHAARELQEGLLPRDLPQLESMEVSGFSVACEAVGGDCYDCFRTPAGKLLLAIGDVSGKGVPGAILAANLQAMVRTEGMRDRSCRDSVRELNRRLCEMQKPERYVTFCLIRIDPLTGAVEYCNAGHPSPLLARVDGRVEDLSLGGLPLGIRPQAAYEEGRAVLRAGDLLVLLTDGITERRRGQETHQEEFGRQRLQELVVRNRRLSARALQQAILGAVREFSPTPLDDDTTLLIVKML